MTDPKSTRASKFGVFIVAILLMFCIAIMLTTINTDEKTKQDKIAIERYEALRNQTYTVTDGMTISLIDFRYIEIDTDLTQFENARVQMLMNEQRSTLFDVEIWREWVLDHNITKKTFRFDTEYIETPKIFIEVESPSRYDRYNFMVLPGTMYYPDYPPLNLRGIRVLHT